MHRTRRACTPADMGTSDDNRYERGMTRKRYEIANTCRIAGAAKQRSNPSGLIRLLGTVPVAVHRTRRACTPADMGTSDDNRYEQGMTRKRHEIANACRIAGAAKQRSNPSGLIRLTKSRSQCTGLYSESMYAQAAVAATAPSEAAVVSWRSVLVRQSPAVKMPGCFVAQDSPALI